MFTGYAIEAPSTGLIEDVRVGLEKGIAYVVNLFRICIRKVLRLPPIAPSHGMEESATLTRRNTAPLPVTAPSYQCP